MTSSPKTDKSNAAEKAPLLSIGMIFKNEERCLERCLQALAPLRAAIPCELVMADTGSTDRSREIAAKYADILFDFPWINDFSAARNAVIDRCSGKWFLTVDADEYLDADVSQLVTFLTAPRYASYDFATIIQRNYNSFEIPSDSFEDFYALRLMRMATGQRYLGRIHESWLTEDTEKVIALTHVILHHDGYADEENSHTKGMRNIPLLEAELAERPEDIRLAMLSLFISYTDEQIQKYGKLVISLIEKRVENWDTFGPPALRTAIAHAAKKNLPELEKWLNASTLLTTPTPFSYVDIVFFKAAYHHANRNFSVCLEEIKKYEKGLVRWEKEKHTCAFQTLSGLYCDTPIAQRRICLFAADCHAQLAQWDDTFRYLKKAFSFKELYNEADLSILISLLNLRKNSHLDMKPLMQTFDPAVLPAVLQELHAFLLTDTPMQAEALLLSVSDWEKVSPLIPEHALLLGARFPESFYSVPVETIKNRAKQAIAFSGKHTDTLLAICCSSPVPETPAQSAWYYYLTATAIQAYEPEDADFSAVHTAFLKHTEAYLYTFYQPKMLTEEHIHFLTPTEQFSWYLLRAQTALETNAIADCVRSLRAALKIAPHMKSLIQYLLEKRLLHFEKCALISARTQAGTKLL